MKHKCRLFYFVLLGLIAQGCGTVASHSGVSWPGDPPSGTTGTYRGVKRDVSQFVSTVPDFNDQPIYAGLWDALVACDLPVSAVADTLVWPFHASNSDSKKPQSTPAAH